MVRKVALGTLLVGLIGVLVAGAIIRTVGKTENVAEARGLGQGRGAGEQVGYGVQQAAWNPATDTQRNGRGAYVQGGGILERQYTNYDSAPEEWISYEGVVTQAPAAGVDLVVKTGEGEDVVIGTGPGYMETQGFALQVGEIAQVSGYWEDGEFKASQITRLADGQIIALGDDAGHPAWAGSGKRASEQQAAIAQGEQGQGRGADRGPAVADPVRPAPIGDDGYTGDLGESEMEALLMALDDEYKAWSIYDQVIADFGAVRPFTNIQRAEENHIAVLVTLFDRYGLNVPVNEWPGDVPAFNALSEACEAGVQAEIDNAALYDQLFSMVDNPDIVRVFAALQRASQDQHLPALGRCAP